MTVMRNYRLFSLFLLLAVVIAGFLGFFLVWVLAPIVAVGVFYLVWIGTRSPWRLRDRTVALRRRERRARLALEARARRRVLRRQG